MQSARDFFQATITIIEFFAICVFDTSFAYTYKRSLETHDTYGWTQDCCEHLDGYTYFAWQKRMVIDSFCKTKKNEKNSQHCIESLIFQVHGHPFEMEKW